MISDLCCVFNVGAIYRRPIFKLIDEEFGCDFYLGDRVNYPLKLMNYHELKGFKGELRYIKLFGNFYWQKGAIGLVWKSYKTFIITGEPHCVSSWILLFCAKVLKKNTVVWTHGWYGRETKLRSFIKKIFFSLASKVMLYGDYAKNLMIAQGYDRNKLFCIYNSLDLDVQKKLRSNLTQTDVYVNHFGNYHPVLLFIGRLDHFKKLDQLVECLAQLHKSGSKCNLILIGEGNELANLINLVDENNLSDFVWFYGPCFEEKELANLIFNAHLGITPGVIGLSVLHCFAYGLPFVGNNNFTKQGPEFESIIPGITGEFFVENDQNDMVNIVSKWLELSRNNRDFYRENCYNILDQKYNPLNQLNILMTNLNFKK